MNATLEPRTQKPIQIEDTTTSPYKELLNRVVDMNAKAARDTLTYYWELGSSVNELEGEKRHVYGDNTVETFVKDLKSNGVELSSSSIYKAAKFNKNCESTELQRLIKSKWSWRNAVLLYSDSVQVARRKEILERVESGELSQDKTRAILRDGDTNLGQRAVRGLSQEANNLETASRTYKTRLAAVEELSHKLKALPIADRRKHREATNSLDRELQVLHKELKNARKILSSIRY